MQMRYVLTNTYRTKASAVVLVLILTPTAFVAFEYAASGSAEAQTSGGSEIMALKPGQRSGIHELNKNPAEYLIEPSNYYEYMGSNMLKLDINGDGNMDLAVAGGYYSYYAPAVRIYDGSSQVMYPNLRETTASSKWKIAWGKSGWIGRRLSSVQCSARS